MFVWTLPVIAGILNGFSWAISSFFRRIPATLLTATAFLVAGIVATCYMFAFGGGIPARIDASYWGALFLNTALLAVAFTLATAAPRFSDLSLVRPVNSLTPVVMLAAGPILAMLGAPATWVDPSFLGVIGVLVVCGGLYGLFSMKGAGVLAPFGALFREKGAFMMLVVVLLYSVTSFYDLIALRASSSHFYLATIFPLISAVCFVFYLCERNFFPHKDKETGEPDVDYRLSSVTGYEWLAAIAQGGLYATATICHMIAIDVTGQVTYVVAIKEGITAIDAAIVLYLLWRFAPQYLDEQHMKEVEELRHRFKWMAIVAVGLGLLILLGR